MYNDESYEQFEKNNSLFVKLGIVILIVGIIVSIICTGYKQETFICSKQQNLCYAEKTNLFNFKTKHKISKYSDIKNVKYIRRKIKGNRMSYGYYTYYVVLEDENKIQKKVFSTSYINKYEAQNTAILLRKQISKNPEKIILNRY